MNLSTTLHVSQLHEMNAEHEGPLSNAMFYLKNLAAMNQHPEK